MKKVIDFKYVVNAQKKASEIAERTNRALQLSYMVVRDNKLIKVHPDGSSEIIKDVFFDTVKRKKGRYTLINE